MKTTGVIYDAGTMYGSGGMMQRCGRPGATEGYFDASG